MFQKIDHVNISIKNIDESVLWYGKVFGFRKVEQGLNMSGSKFAIIENQDTMICMSEYPGWTSPDLKGNKNQHQIFHFGFRIKDETKWKELIEKLDLTFTYDEISYPRSKSWYVLDLNGYEIEVSYLKEGVAMFGD